MLPTTEARQQTLDIFNRPKVPLDFIPISQMDFFPPQKRNKLPTSPITESDGEDMRQILQEPNIETTSSIVHESSMQANMATNTGLAPADEPNPCLLSIILPRETTSAPPFESDEERLIPGLRRVSTIQRRPTHLQQNQLPE